MNVTLLLGDGKYIVSPKIIDVSKLGFFDGLEYDSWNLFLQYCAAFGIKIVGDRDEPDWHTAKQIQDKIIEILTEAGVEFKFENEEPDISHICYELYKLDWKSSHGITAEIEKLSLSEYYSNLDLNDDISYEDYLDEFGYDGELYACFEEFCENEYLDDEYMHKLLNDEYLIDLYDEDISEEL